MARIKFYKNTSDSRYGLEQVFLSHLDNDHISCIEEFDKFFNPRYLTVPCEHPKQNSIFNIIKSFFIKPDSDNPNVERVLELMSKRLPGHGRGIQEDMDRPLVVYPSCQGNIELYHIPANICASEELLKNDYKNNISLALFIKINGHKIFMPGDLMKEAMEYLIMNNESLKADLNSLGIDFLVVPHHGLTTAFPEVLFKTMKDSKTNRLNVISEKIREADSDEPRSDVDSRYYDEEHCSGINNLDGQRGIKTSGGHIVIDYSNVSPIIKIINTENKEGLIREFI